MLPQQPLKTNVTGMILAAGQGKRMANTLPKVMHNVLGKPMITRCLNALFGAGIERAIVVISRAQHQLQEFLSAHQVPHGCYLEMAFQDAPQGTAHAVAQGLAERTLPTGGHLVVAFGDTPLISSATYQSYLKYHFDRGSDATILAFSASDPYGYGRVLTNENNEFVAIREEKDCTPHERGVTLVNSGLLIAKNEIFSHFLPLIRNENAASEYYLTDLPMLVKNSGGRVGVFQGTSHSEFFGVNSQMQLAQVSRLLQEKIIADWMLKGVQFVDPQTVYLDDDVVLQPGVVVEPFVFLSGKQVYRSGQKIQAGTGLITNAATGVGRGAKSECERRVHETYTSEPSEEATTANTCGRISIKG